MDNIDNNKGILEHAITKENDNLLLDDNGVSEDNQQIIIKTKSTYICKKSIVDDSVEKKKKDKEIKIIREYKNLISSQELIERIIKSHLTQDGDIDTDVNIETI